MEPFKASKLPIEYSMDKELLLLILDSIILSESLKSTQIEGIQISQDEMYYLK